MKRTIFRIEVYIIVFIVGMVVASLSFQGCSMFGEKMKSLSDMTPQEKVTMAYNMYNFQYSSYMKATGWIPHNGTWEKSTVPILSEDEKKLLRKKKQILEDMYPLIRLYDNMVIGLVPYNVNTEESLFNLIDELSALL